MIAAEQLKHAFVERVHIYILDNANSFINKIWLDLYLERGHLYPVFESPKTVGGSLPNGLSTEGFYHPLIRNNGWSSIGYSTNLRIAYLFGLKFSEVVTILQNSKDEELS